MGKLFEARIRKLDWARRNPAKVREANRRYRLTNQSRIRAQTAERMRRLRQRRAALSAIT